MITPPGRQVLLFAAGGVRFALPLAAVREIVKLPAAPGRPAPGRSVALAAALGLEGDPRFALILEGEPPVRLGVDEMRGVADLAEAEVFRLPERSVAVRPSPFAAAMRLGEVVHLELAPAALEHSRRVAWRTPPVQDDLPWVERELVAERGGRALAVPLSLVVQVIDRAPLSKVPLAPPGHRGLLHHGRAIHPVWDAASLLSWPEIGDPRVILLLDAGGTTAGVLVDRVRGLGEGEGSGPVRRPHWDALLAPREEG
jgi:chemotaxis signal transduction protein